ncbi:MAG: alpha-glucosidase C-terminal domain-containing protein, partial [Nitrospirales bacterium]
RVFAHDRPARIHLGIRRRLAPLLGNDRRKIELMNSLLFSLPGTPVLYYGDEIGMGDNFYLGDRNGVRTPMQWSADRNAGFSRANPQKLYLPVTIDPEYHYEAVNVELQQNNPQSLLWWMKRMLSLRNRHQVFGRGTIEFLHPNNRKVLAFVRKYEQEAVLVVTNLSRFAQGVELDLSGFKGMVPMDLFGQTKFFPIEDRPYLLTLAPHSFFWFALQPDTADTAVVSTERTLRKLTVPEQWTEILEDPHKTAVEALLPTYMKERRWFAGKARTIQSVEFVDAIPIPPKEPVGFVTLVHVDYTEGEPETYALPLGFARGELATQLQDGPAAIARVQVKETGEEGLLCDAAWDRIFLKALLGTVARVRRVKLPGGELVALPTKAFKPLLGSAEEVLEPALMKGEQSNTSVVFGDLFILKLYRRMETGINPDLEIGRLLTERKFPNIAPVASSLEYAKDRNEPITLVILQSFLPNEGDAWRHTLDTMSRYYEDVLSRAADLTADLIPQTHVLDLAAEPVPPLAQELIALYLEEARLLGQRTGEMHLALAQDQTDPSFAPEAFTDFYRRGLYQSMMG